MQWLFWIFVTATVSAASDHVEIERQSWNDYDNFIAEHIPGKSSAFNP
jgi:hypothetical protein